MLFLAHQQGHKVSVTTILIDDAATQSLANQYDYITVVSDTSGNAWWKLSALVMFFLKLWN